MNKNHLNENAPEKARQTNEKVSRTKQVIKKGAYPVMKLSKNMRENIERRLFFYNLRNRKKYLKAALTNICEGPAYFIHTLQCEYGYNALYLNESTKEICIISYKKEPVTYKYYEAQNCEIVEVENNEFIEWDKENGELHRRLIGSTDVLGGAVKQIELKVTVGIVEPQQYTLVVDDFLLGAGTKKGSTLYNLAMNKAREWQSRMMSLSNVVYMNTSK